MIRTNRCHLGPEFPIYSGPAISALPQCTMKPVHRFNALVSPWAYGRKGQEPPGWPFQDLDCSIQPLATSSNCDHAATPLFFSKIISINAVTVNIWSNYLLLFNIWGSQFYLLAHFQTCSPNPERKPNYLTVLICFNHLKSTTQYFTLPIYQHGDLLCFMYLHVIYTLYFILYNHVPLIHKATVVFPGDVVYRNRQKRI